MLQHIMGMPCLFNIASAQGGGTQEGYVYIDSELITQKGHAILKSSYYFTKRVNNMLCQAGGSWLVSYLCTLLLVLIKGDLQSC